MKKNFYLAKDTYELVNKLILFVDIICWYYLLILFVLYVCIILFALHVQCLSLKYQASDIISMDETPVWSDMVSDTTVDTTCTNTVTESTGYEKSRVSVCLAAKAMVENCLQWLSSRMQREKSVQWIKYSDKCLMKESVKSSLHAKKIDMDIVPYGCTKYIQIPDGTNHLKR